MSVRKLSRRRLVRGAVFTTAAMAAAACQSAPPPEPKVVERVVEKPVEVTRVVEKPVEKIVEKPVQVVVTQVVEKVVAATPAPCVKDWNQRIPPPFKKYDPPVEVALIFQATPTFPSGYDFQNNPVFNFDVKEMGLKMNIHWQASGDARNQKLQADIAAGTLADMVEVNRVTADQLIDAGAVAEIRDIWEKTASPLVKERLNYPDGPAWLPAFRGNQLFAVNPSITAKVFTPISHIRKDLLDKAGLPMPKTVDDLDKALHAFKSKNLIQYGMTGYNGPLVDNSHSFNMLFGAHGVMPTTWRDPGDGKLAYDSLAPGVKTVLGLLRGWYKDGLIPPDYYTFDWTAALNQATQGKSATIVGPMWLIGTGRVSAAEEANPGAKFEVLPLLTGPNGQRGNKATNPVFNSWVFRKGLEPIKIEALINQLNWVFEYHVNGPSDKYQAYGAMLDDSLFLEGYDWNWNANCEIELTKFNSGSPVLNVGFHHVTNPGYSRDVHKYLLEWDQMDRSKLNKGQKFFLDKANSRREAVAYKMNFDNEQYEIEDKFYGPRTKRMNDLWANLTKIEGTYFTGIVIGEKSLDDFDKFVAEWRSGGGDEFTAGVNQWYATQKR